MRPLPEIGTCTRHCQCAVVLCSVIGCWVVSRNHQRRRAAWVCTSVATAVASACGGKTEPADPSDDGSAASGRRVTGWGFGLRGAPRPDRPALSAQASADRPARSPRCCTRNSRRRTRLRAPSACSARTSGSRCSRCNAAQPPPIELPVGTVLGIFLGPVGERHSKPADVAVPALPGVCPTAILNSEHAAAEDTAAVEGVSSRIDRRHAATVSLVFDRPGTNTPCSLHTHSNPQRHTVTLAVHTHPRTHTRAHTSVCSGSRRSHDCERLRDALRARWRRVALQRCKQRHVAYNKNVRWDRQRTKRHHARENIQHAACNVTRCDVGQATDSAHHATWDTGAGNRQ
jgi:hypothetical protein